MNTQAPISSLMTTDLVTVEPEAKLKAVKEIFDTRNIHHVPVVREETIIGLISKVDLLHFLKGMSSNSYEEILNETRLRNYCAEEIMTKGLTTLPSNAALAEALEIFKENRFHAIPVVDDKKLCGILTTFDIIEAVAQSDSVKV